MDFLFTALQSWRLDLNTFRIEMELDRTKMYQHGRNIDDVRRYEIRENKNKNHKNKKQQQQNNDNNNHI